MRANSQFTVALHILTWMALVTPRREVVTSDQIAASVNTNPVFIRRILGVLNKAHLVNVQHGTGAGWTLARRPEEISLAEVYQALEQPPLFELHHTLPNQACPIGKGIQPALKRVYASAESLLLEQFGQITVADMLAETLAPSPQTATQVADG